MVSKRGGSKVWCYLLCLAKLKKRQLGWRWFLLGWSLFVLLCSSKNGWMIMDRSPPDQMTKIVAPNVYDVFMTHLTCSCTAHAKLPQPRWRKVGLFCWMDTYTSKQTFRTARWATTGPYIRCPGYRFPFQDWFRWVPTETMQWGAAKQNMRLYGHQTKNRLYPGKTFVAWASWVDEIAYPKEPLLWLDQWSTAIPWDW